MVMGDDSCFRGRGFKSRRCILDGQKNYTATHKSSTLRELSQFPTMGVTAPTIQLFTNLQLV